MKDTEFAQFANGIRLTEVALADIVEGLAGEYLWSYIEGEHVASGRTPLTQEQIAAIKEWTKGPGRKYVEAAR
jgi:hypothetical protein